MAANWEDRRWNSSFDDRTPQIPKQIEGSWEGHGTVCACCGEVHGCDMLLSCIMILGVLLVEHGWQVDSSKYID